VASHLSVTTSTGGIATTKSFNASPPAEAGKAGNVFAALLGSATPQSGATSRSSQSAGEFSLANLFNLQFEAGDGEEPPPEDPEAIAAVIDAVLPIQPPVAPPAAEMLADLVEDLTSLKTSLDAGKPADPDLVARIGTQLDDLAETLGIPLDDMPSLDQIASLAAKAPAGDASPLDSLTEALAPLAASLAQTKAGADANPLQSLGEKLGAFLAALQTTELPADQLADLGLNPGSPEEFKLKDALASLAASVDAALAPEEPALATPQLKLTEPVLSGRTEEPSDQSASAETEAPPLAQTDPDGEPDDQSAGQDRSAPDTRPESKAAASSAPVFAEKAADPVSASQPQATRIEATTAPRPVQAGYQPSQQQINLPQLAFELVRQVNDGNSRFQIRLDPPELGKIDVKLDIDPTGQVNARLTVEKAETLDLMQRDQRSLERALQQAGLDGAKTNLEFSLKQNPFSGSGSQQGREQGTNGFAVGRPAEGAEEAPPPITLYRGSLSAGGVNIMA